MYKSCREKSRGDETGNEKERIGRTEGQGISELGIGVKTPLRGKTK